MNGPRIIRIGNDLIVRWTVLTNGRPDSLEGRNLSLELWHSNGHRVLTDFTVAGNTLSWAFPGREQKWTGPYLLTLVENKGMTGMATVDSKAFVLVARMFDKNGLTEPNEIQLTTGDLAIEAGGYSLATSESHGLMSADDKQWADLLADWPALTPDDAVGMVRQIFNE